MKITINNKNNKDNIPDFSKRASYNYRFSGENGIKLTPLQCPNCGADLSINDSGEIAICNKCRSSFYINDIGSDTQRALKAQSEAIKEDYASLLEYEENREITRSRLEWKETRKGCLFIICIFVLFVIMALTFIIINRIQLKSGMIAIPGSDEEFIGADYKDVYNELVEAGFTNIKLKESLNDLPSDRYYGKVETILIGVSDNFSPGDARDPNTRIVITYYPESIGGE